MKTPALYLSGLTRLGLLALLTTLVHQPSTGLAQSSAFTYQGSLSDAGSPASGIYDLRFEIYDTDSGGSAVASPVTNTAVAVSNGLFLASLDFGAGAFDGSDRWLEIGVVTNGGGAFSTLSPRQQITSTPYAVQAANAASADTANSVAAGNITGTIPLAQLPTEVVTNGASGVNFSGTFGGDGAGLTNVWHTSGNAGTTAGTHFLGTTDNRPLQLKANNQLGFRLEYPTVGTVPNLVGGFSGNSVGAGSEGVVIAGGGRLGFTNSVGLDSRFSVIGGGYYNRITNSSWSATISGGEYNTIGLDSDRSTIGGGAANDIGNGSAWSTVAGGDSNDIFDSSANGFIGGGYDNTISGSSWYATISGGRGNLIGTDCDAGAIGGGWGNSIGIFGSNTWMATIAGGIFNAIGIDSDYSTIGGGRENYTTRNATYATIPGGGYNVATNFAFAAGYRAEALHTGAFVWADSTETNFTSTASNQFNVRASGGVRLETTGAGTSLDGKQVPVGEEQLRIVRGGVSSAGSPTKGAGFTSVRNSTGLYTVTFSTPFNGVPSITFAPDWYRVYASTENITSNSFQAHFLNQNIGWEDTAFDFIAIGPR